jgi:hypothetical protein
MLAVIISIGCSKKASDEIDFGTVENHVYQNNYFGMSIKLPEKWSIHDLESRRQIMDTGGHMIAGEDKNLQAAVKAAELTTVYMVSISKYPIGAPVDSNQMFQCIAEKVRHMPGIVTGKDYLFHARKLLESSQVQYAFLGETTNKIIGGQEFGLLESEMYMAGQQIRQNMYATIINGYALLLISSFSNDDDGLELESILENITFE